MTLVEFLDGLNEQQKQAVTAPNGAVLVLAGPGSGKTRVLTRRIAYLIGARGISPYHILAVTFTNRAAREMESRVTDLLGSEQRGMMLGTFHSVCARILRRESRYLGLTQDFTIFDEDDQQSLVKKALRELNIDDKLNKPAAVLSAISRAKNDMLDPEGIEVKGYKDQVIQRVYTRYQQLLLSCNALDFDDLLLGTARILHENGSVREAYAQRFEHILVDEFQDTNRAQYMLLQYLASYHHNLFVVGDEDQSIYRWRGADYHNVLLFEQDYPNRTKILLEKNYRSTQKILDAARAVIDRNPNRTVKRLHTDRVEGERINLYECNDDRSEAEYVANKIKTDISHNRYAAKDVAVMYRTNAQSRLMEEAFLHAGLRYRLVGAQRFYGRREVKDCIAYLRLVHNPADDVSFERVVNTPARGIGEKSIQTLRDYSSSLRTPEAGIAMDLSKGTQSAHWSAFNGASANRLADFGSRLQEWITEKDSVTLPELFRKILSDINYREYLDDGTEEGVDRWENVEELMRLTYEYEQTGLVPFLENLALVADQDTLPESPDATTLLTLHASKGLEFKVVFIVGLEEKVLPHSRSFDDPEQMSEERRLFYVGITRTKDKLYLTRAESRAMFGGYDYSEPSRFLQDIPAELINRENSPRRMQGRFEWKDQYSPTDYTWNKTPVTPVKQQQSVEQKYKANMRVKHPTWGDGLVLDSKILDGDEVIDVAFESVGFKKLIASMAGLVILES